MIALDHGGIHQNRSVDMQRREFNEWITKNFTEKGEARLVAINAWLASLSDKEINTAYAGKSA